MDDLDMASCCRSAWPLMQQAWQQQGNAAAFWDAYQRLLSEHDQGELAARDCANRIARMAQRLGAIDVAMLV